MYESWNSSTERTAKLSSGYKINRAGDNAAGPAIIERMRSETFKMNGNNLVTYGASTITQFGTGTMLITPTTDAGTIVRINGEESKLNAGDTFLIRPGTEEYARSGLYFWHSVAVDEDSTVVKMPIVQMGEWSVEEAQALMDAVHLSSYAAAYAETNDSKKAQEAADTATKEASEKIKRYSSETTDGTNEAQQKADFVSYMAEEYSQVSNNMVKAGNVGYDPSGTIDRDEAASMIDRLLEDREKSKEKNGESIWIGKQVYDDEAGWKWIYLGNSDDSNHDSNPLEGFCASGVQSLGEAYAEFQETIAIRTAERLAREAQEEKERRRGWLH